MGNAASERSRQQLPKLRDLPSLLDEIAWQKIGLWVIVSLLTTGIPASVEAGVQKLTSDTITLGFDSLFAQTAPLIWSVAMVAFACHRGWLDEAGMIPSAGLILFGGWLGHLFQHGAMVTAVDWLPTDRYALLGSVVFAAVNLLVAYFLSYGPGAFIASVIVGTVLGITWSRALLNLQRSYRVLQIDRDASLLSPSSQKAA